MAIAGVSLAGAIECNCSFSRTWLPLVMCELSAVAVSMIVK
jgi:hypothetical protein